MDRSWYQIIHLVVTLRGGEAQTQQAYIQQCLRTEANGEAAILPSPEELDLMLADLGSACQSYIRAFNQSFEQFRRIEQLRATEQSRPIEEFPETELASESESGRIQFSPCQVDKFLQTLARVGMSTLEESEEATCSICLQEYGTDRGEEVTSGTTEPPGTLEELMVKGYQVEKR